MRDIGFYHQSFICFTVKRDTSELTGGKRSCHFHQVVFVHCLHHHACNRVMAVLCCALSLDNSATFYRLLCRSTMTADGRWMFIHLCFYKFYEVSLIRLRSDLYTSVQIYCEVSFLEYSIAICNNSLCVKVWKSTDDLVQDFMPFWWGLKFRLKRLDMSLFQMAFMWNVWMFSVNRWRKCIAEIKHKVVRSCWIVAPSRHAMLDIRSEVQYYSIKGTVIWW